MDNKDFLKAEIRVPHNIEAEKSIIGCLLQNNDLIEDAQTIVSYEMFYDSTFRALFKSIVELKNDNFSIDTITLKDKVMPKSEGFTVVQVIDNVRKKVVEQGFDISRLDESFFVDIIRSTPITANLKDHCNIVKDKFILRRTIDLCERVIIDCRSNIKSTEEILNAAQEKLYDYSKKNSKIDYVKLDSLIPIVLDNVEKASKVPDGITGVKSGYKNLDNVTAGFQKSNMIVLAARPGVGKTTFSLNLAYNVSKKYNGNVLYFTLEMGASELATKILSMESGISTTLLKNGRLNDMQWPELIEGAKNINGTNIYIDDDPSLTIASLRNKSQKLASELQMKNKALDMIIIDYLQLMGVGEGVLSASNRQEEVASISRNIKALAKDLDIPIIALSQVSREAAKKEPNLADIRESGAIEQDADIVMFLHKPDPNDQFKTDIIFAKHRSGNTETISLRFDKATSRFNEYDFSK